LHEKFYEMLFSRYFSVESTQEMLDEWRPLLCPFDVKMSEGLFFLELFLPTLMYPHEYDHGFRCNWSVIVVVVVVVYLVSLVVVVARETFSFWNYFNLHFLQPRKFNHGFMYAWLAVVATAAVVVVVDSSVVVVVLWWQHLFKIWFFFIYGLWFYTKFCVLFKN